MTAYESVSANVKQILDNFEQFILLIQQNDWLQNQSMKATKNCFMLSLFVEDTVNSFKSKKCLPLFINILHSHLANKGLLFSSFDGDFFNNASDHLLVKFLKDANLDVITLDIAIRIYTMIFPKTRFEFVINDLILRCASINALKDYTLSSKADLSELECRLLVDFWSNELRCGCKHNVKSAVVNMFSAYKIEKSLPVLAKVLSFDNNTPEDISIKNLILEVLLEKMRDRSVLSNSFWVTLFKKVSHADLCKTCGHFNDIFVELFSFIIYIGSMMNVDEISCCWIGDSDTSICPEITYEDLFKLIKSLHDFTDGNKDYIKRRIKNAISKVGSPIWKQIEVSL